MTVKDIPLERLLVETDAPYLAPVPKRGKDPTSLPSLLIPPPKSPSSKVSRSPSSKRPPPTISFVSSARRIAPRRSARSAHNHPGLRYLGRRAAAGAARTGRGSGAQPTRPIRATAAGAARSWCRTRARPSWSTPRPTCASSCWTPEVERVDVVLWTHDHADQLHGIDDLRPFMLRHGQIESWSDARTYGGAAPALRLLLRGAGRRLLQSDLPPQPDRRAVSCRRDPVVPIPQDHGTIPSLGFRFGRFAYSNDVVNCRTRRLRP